MPTSKHCQFFILPIATHLPQTHSVTMQFNWHERDMHASSPRTVQTNKPHRTPLPPNIQHNCCMVSSHWLPSNHLADHFLEMVSGNNNVKVTVAKHDANINTWHFPPCDPCQPQHLPSFPLCPCQIECQAQKFAWQPPSPLGQHL